MSVMIERMAKAASGCDLSSWHPNVQDQLKKQMRDILEAMSEPTEAMMDQIIYCDLRTITEGVGLWKAMVEAAKALP